MRRPFPGDEVAVVTGGSRGIGLATAQALVNAGMRVVVVGRTRTRLRAAAGELLAGAQGGSDERGATSRVLAVTADVSKPGDVRRAVQQTLARFGRIDVLVNNAGISGRGRVEDLSERDWDRVLSVNLRGAFLCARAVLPSMKRQRRGYIVNISSLAVKIGIGGRRVSLALKVGPVGVGQY